MFFVIEITKYSVGLFVLKICYHTKFQYPALSLAQISEFCMILMLCYSCRKSKQAHKWCSLTVASSYMMFIPRFLEIDHWKKWFYHSVRCVDRVTVGCLYTMSAFCRNQGIE